MVRTAPRDVCDEPTPFGMEAGMAWFSSSKRELVEAARSGDAAAVQAALAAGADANATHWNKTPLMFAAENGHADAIRLLLAAGADPNASTFIGENVLVRAVLNGHLEAVRALLAGGAEADRQNVRGESTLLAIANSADFKPTAALNDIVRELVQAGLDVNARDKEDRSALVAAIERDSIELVRALLGAGADPNDQFVTVVNPGSDSQYKVATTALIRAAALAREEMVEALLQAGADANAEGAAGATAMMLAAGSFRGEVAAAYELSDIVEGFFDAYDPDPSIRARIVRALAAAGGDVDARGPNGSTALMWAANVDRDEVIRALAAERADLDASCESHVTYVREGVIFDSRDHKDRSGVTALMIAAKEGRKKAAVALIEAGANLDLKDSDGLTARTLAKNYIQVGTGRAMDDAIQARTVQPPLMQH